MLHKFQNNTKPSHNLLCFFNCIFAPLLLYIYSPVPQVILHGHVAVQQHYSFDFNDVVTHIQTEIVWLYLKQQCQLGNCTKKIAGYLGKKDDFDEALVDFSAAYADQNELDYKAFVQAVREGRLEVYLESWGDVFNGSL